MKFALSALSTVNNIYALAALDGARPESPLEAVNTNLLCPDRLPALKILIKNEFAALAGALFPYVTECDVDGESPIDDHSAAPAAPDWIMTLGIPAADRLHPGLGGAMRRMLEQILSERCLAAVYSLAGIPAPARADAAQGLLLTVRSQLGGVAGTLGAAEVSGWRV